MSASVLDAPVLRAARSALAHAPRARAAGGGRATLEELLDGTWRTIRGDGHAECPVCHAAMTLTDGLGRCEDCGSTLG
jgi:hypothetical protein